MIKLHIPHHRSISRRLATYVALMAFAAPITVTATPPTSEIEPTPAMADPCEKSTVQLEIDVTTGNVYLVDPETGGMTLTDNDITVGFGSLGHVVVNLHYSSSNWAVTVTPDGSPPTTYRTTNGWMRYSISDEVGHYVFSSTALTTFSATANMTPVVPDIIIRTDPDCPPPT
jgi:hypothetical protein